ncbi:MAG: trypsin-like peptidase domain-containing protein [Acidimicrobiia bacterium]
MTQEPTTQDRKRMPGTLIAVLFFGGVAMLVAAIAWLAPSDAGGATAVATTTTVANGTGTAGSVNVVAPAIVVGEEPVADAAEVILPSVVDITTDRGSGSGVIYQSDGLIVTAAHVVDGAESIWVRFGDGEQVKASVLGTAPEVDIAVVKVDRTGLPAATFSTAKPRVGQLAIAVGSPWGLESTVTAGIISAVDQAECSTLSTGKPTCTSLVQTDAAINPGNSGGALVDRDGHVVGINVSIISTSGANDGVGFAVPSGIVTAYADAIVSGKPLQTAFLGVQADNVGTEGRAGAEITNVVSGSAAEDAGIQVGDVIISFDGVPVLGFNDLVAQVRAHQPGETVDTVVIRDGNQATVSVTLGVDEETLG